MSFASVPHPESASGSPERLNELLIDRALWGLDENEERELEAAIEHGADEAAGAYDHAVAALALAFDADPEPMPEALRKTLCAAGAGFVEGVSSSRDPRPTPESQVVGTISRAVVLAWSGWLAAAACLLFVFTISRAPTVPTLEQRIAALEIRAPDVVRANWASLTAIGADRHPLDNGVSGVVIWSDELDEGYMRISGIIPNDPSEFQYQLWIFDARRPAGDLPRFRAEGLPEILTQRPIDGGVFDVTSDCEVIVPINAKLPVGEGVLFAVTKEPPGGVVVSDRDIVFLALKG